MKKPRMTIFVSIIAGLLMFTACGNGSVQIDEGSEIPGFANGGNAWEREGDVAFVSTDPGSADFLKPTPDGGFADIGAYASAGD